MTGAGVPPRDDSTVLRLDLGIDDVPFSRLIEAQVHFLGMLREVSTELVGEPDSVRWIVSEVLAESVDILVRPEAAPARTVPTEALRELPRVVEDGLARLERSAVRPRFFNDIALERLKSLGQLAGNGITHITVRADGKAASVTNRTVSHVVEVVGQTTTAIGTIEGRLDAVTVHGRRAFYVWDALTDEKIECDFGRRIETSAVAVAIEQRVAVTGEIRYRENGEIQRIRAQTIFVFPPQSAIPSADDVRGILAEPASADDVRGILAG